MWNYRLVNDVTNESEYEVVKLCEVYYDKLRDNQPYGFHRADLQSEDAPGLLELHKRINDAFEKPILVFPDDFAV